MTATTDSPSSIASSRPRARPAAAPAAARHRRRRERPAAARPHGRPGLRPAVPARQGAGGRHAALLPPPGEGVFDEADVRRRADELADFVAEAREAYGLAAPIAVGFSNGANIAAAVLPLRPEALAGAVLLRAMVPLQDPPAADLTGKPVLLLSGLGPHRAGRERRAAGAHLKAAGADVQHRVLPVGHGLSQADVSLTKAWINQL